MPAGPLGRMRLSAIPATGIRGKFDDGGATSRLGSRLLVLRLE
ncbi:hypothetical protein [Arthrobacter sp. LjRoot14]